MKVSIIFGSASDTEVMRGAGVCLSSFGIEYNARILSAHRVPDALSQHLTQIEKDGYEVIIAGAGLAAHLPGVIASQTLLPVIGVPINAALDGLDSLLSIVQMPKNIPVATVGINNSFNAGLLAVQILAIKYPNIQNKLKDFRKKMREGFLQQNNTHITL